MSKSTLSDLRAQAAKKPTSYATRILPDVCLDQDATAKVQRLMAEHANLEQEESARQEAESEARDTDAPKPPSKLAEAPEPSKPNPRLAEVSAEIEALWEAMRPSTGDILLTAIDGGEWMRWKDDNPAREDNQSDMMLTFGICNATALAADLGRYVIAWNDEAVGPEDWSGWMSARVSSADRGAAVRMIVEMHETRLSVPKGLSGSSVTAPDETA